MKRRSVVVTGIGLVTPLGPSRDETWKRLMAGDTGIRAEAGRLIARVLGVSPNGAHSRAGDFAVLAAAEALAHARLDPASTEIGCAIGQSKPLVEVRSGECGMRSDKNPLRAPNSALRTMVDPYLLLSSFTGWSLEAVVKSHFELRGPSANVAAACATGVAAIETAATWIESGVCDVALAGAAESSLSDFYRAGFERLGVLAPGSDPSAVRPFDRNRAGFAMGEGAAVLVLESEDKSRARGVPPLARLTSSALRQSSVDAIHFDNDGADVARLIAAATDGKPAPAYVNAHGTATRLNDAAEAKGLRRVFGERSALRVGSTKASTGHLLGAAGAVEAAFAALAVATDSLPPSLHIESPDELCAFDLVRRPVGRAGVSSALSLSYGFGGQMGAVLWERP